MGLQFGTWGVDTRNGWQAEFDKLTQYDFERLGIEKDQLNNILQKLHEWKVIRCCDCVDEVKFHIVN